MMRRELSILLTIVGAASLVGACAASTGEADVTATVELQADYPPYDTAGLFREATLIVEGVPLATESTILTPRTGEGDTPEENPWLGLSEEEKAKALKELENDWIAGTAVTFRVDAAYKGAFTPGDEVTIIQPGGVVDGVDYRVEGDTMLAIGQRYLVFAKDSFDGAFTILGGSAGTYISTEDGVFTAASPHSAAAEHFTAAEVESLAQSDQS